MDPRFDNDAQTTGTLPGIGAGAMSLHAVVREPAGEPEGALVLFHGRGADEHDLLPLLDVLDPERRLLGLTPRGPLSLPPGGAHWYVVPRVGYPDHDTFHAAYRALAQFHDEVWERTGIAPERTIFGVQMSLRQAIAFTRFSPSPLTFLTQRSRLDAYLVEQAIRAGATFRAGQTVRAVETGNAGVTRKVSRMRRRPFWEGHRQQVCAVFTQDFFNHRGIQDIRVNRVVRGASQMIVDTTAKRLWPEAAVH